MRVLILGAEGMLGSALCEALSQETDRPSKPLHPIAGIRRRLPRDPFPEVATIASGIDACRLSTVRQTLDQLKPDAVVNAIGLVKSRQNSANLREFVDVNAAFPHALAGLCRARQIRMIHVSTDCVFDGRRGDYGETDPITARDVYGRTKALGEVVGPDILTLRTSMIGLERHTKRGLLSWFLNAESPVRGYQNCIFTGPTAPELGRLIIKILRSEDPIGGLLHAGSIPIDKYTLLNLVREAFALPTTIISDGLVRIDRSLRTTRLCERFAYEPRGWPQLIDELAETWRTWQGASTRTPLAALA